MKTPIEEKWSRIFASKRYHTKDGVIKFKPLEQQELIDDLRKTAAKEKEQREELVDVLDTLKRVYDTMPNCTNRVFVKSAMDGLEVIKKL